MTCICGKSICGVKTGWTPFEETACYDCEWLEKGGYYCTYNNFFRRISTVSESAPCLKTKHISGSDIFVNIEPKYRKFKAPAVCGKLDVLSMKLLEEFMEDKQILEVDVTNEKMLRKGSET